MRLVTPEILATTAAERWKYGFCTGRARGDWYSEDARKIHEKLVALGPNPSPSDVDNVIGNSSWTRQYCNEPQCESVAFVEVGQVPDYESATAALCIACLYKAAALAGPL